MSSYNRYKRFVSDGKFRMVPFVQVPENGSDKYIIFHKDKDRLDKLSYDVYGDSNYGWFILQANPSVGSMEFNIPDGSQLRIPFPLKQSLEGYISMIDLYDDLN